MAALTKWRWRFSNRYATPDEAEKPIFGGASPTAEVIIGFGHPVYTISDPRSDIVKEIARKLAVDRG